MQQKHSLLCFGKPLFKKNNLYFITLKIIYVTKNFILKREKNDISIVLFIFEHLVLVFDHLFVFYIKFLGKIKENLFLLRKKMCSYACVLFIVKFLNACDYIKRFLTFYFHLQANAYIQ